MINKPIIQNLRAMCVEREMKFVISYPNPHEVCFSGVTDMNKEFFSVVVFYNSNNNERLCQLYIDSSVDTWTNGVLDKQEVLTLLAVDELDDSILGKIDAMRHKLDSIVM